MARILIADDDESLRLLYQEEFSAEGHELHFAATGREAVELARQVRPDLIVMDIRMPEMDGLEATRAIKQECPGTEILMVTMHENRDYMLEATKAGAAGYVLKDASRNELISAMRRIVDAESPSSRSAHPSRGVSG